MRKRFALSKSTHKLLRSLTKAWFFVWTTIRALLPLLLGVVLFLIRLSRAFSRRWSAFRDPVDVPVPICIGTFVCGVWFHLAPALNLRSHCLNLNDSTVTLWCVFLFLSE